MLPPTARAGNLAHIEPGIRAILDEAAAIRRSTGRRSRWPAYSYLKARLQRLVGWYALRPELRSSDAYDLAIGALIDRLGV